MCPECDGFAERRTFETPADYVAFVRRLVPKRITEKWSTYVVIVRSRSLETPRHGRPGMGFLMNFNARYVASSFSFLSMSGMAGTGGNRKARSNGLNRGATTSNRTSGIRKIRTWATSQEADPSLAYPRNAWRLRDPKAATLRMTPSLV